MLFSKSFIQTSKEIPNDIDTENISQVLMHRAGMIKRMGNGLYVHMPLMLGVMDRVMDEIRRSMSTVDCAEVKFPVIVSKPDLVESGRWEVFGKEIFKLRDRNDKDIALSPTNEEAACFMARQCIKSHNQLPLCLFQIQKKYRDEISPRGGVMRTKEFTMKDAYSFHMTADCLDKYFDKMQDAYTKCFENLGLKTIHVTASNGAMGGRKSREFMVISPVGSDTLVRVGKDWYNEEVAPKGKKHDEKVTGYELGHIFALGQHYSKTLNITATGKDGKPQLLEMGCYGIGVERVVAAIIEQHHDEKGICFPENIAPIVHNVITVNMDDPECVTTSKRIYEEIKKRGESVIWDERDVSAGIKLKDSDLLGIPNKIVVSKKGVSYEKRN